MNDRKRKIRKLLSQYMPEMMCLEIRGRVYVPTDIGYTALARIIMENVLNRKLKKWEVVHHVDGNPKNNNLSNLEVLTRSEHKLRHAKRQPKRNPSPPEPTLDSLRRFKNRQRTNPE